MRFLSMQRPLVAAAGGLARISATRAAPTGAQLAARTCAPVGVRFASVKAQGAYKKKSKRGIPKKLGAKRTGGTWPPPDLHGTAGHLSGESPS